MGKRDNHFNVSKYLGKRFGKLTIMEVFSTDGSYVGTRFLCKCDCGKIIIKDLHFLKRKGKLAKSCGCLYLTQNKLSRRYRRLYTTFLHIKDRCCRKAQRPPFMDGTFGFFRS